MGWKGETETQGRRTGPPTNRHRVTTEDKRCVGRRLVDEIVGGMERRQKATSHRTPRHARAEWYLPHRDGLVDWLVVAAEDLSLSGTTLATAVYCMDRTLSKMEVGLGKLYLVAASCLMVAAKFEEREVDVPSLKSLHNYMGRMYSTQSFVNMEKHVLKATSWKIACCSYAHCLDTYMSMVCEPPMSKEQESRARVCSARDESDLGKTASVTMTHALYSTEILNVFKPSAVAVAVLMVSMDHLGWDADLQTVILTGIGDWCFDQEIVRISRVIQLVCRLKFPEHCVMQDLITGGFSQSTMGVASTSPKSTLDMNALQIG